MQSINDRNTYFGISKQWKNLKFNWNLLPTNKGWLEQGFGTPEPLVSDRDNLTIRKFVAFFERRWRRCSGHFLFKIECNIAKLLFNVTHNFSFSWKKYLYMIRLIFVKIKLVYKHLCVFIRFSEKNRLKSSCWIPINKRSFMTLHRASWYLEPNILYFIIHIICKPDFKLRFQTLKKNSKNESFGFHLW